ncbi:16S rRNA (guanine(527)-N(7))-methyltransferase RsmG [Rugosimonospora acidiphila]|uniref:Ribosomal RNA small subunit methyltransferase G n=1 Tax=Rugosimonospora acidiphila TaxID=556531 RepID=A0ABP9RZI5_9ACTN
MPLPESLLPAARALFGDRLPLARQYADLLATDGVLRGLIGPREAPRIWDRHLLNCAAMTELIQPDALLVDVGSGAGLPGIVLAVARPDLTVALVEPLARRTVFLDEMVDRLGLGAQVSVLRGRAEEFVRGPLSGRLSPADVVTARAVAPIDRLAAWCLPLSAIGGRLLAIKGASAADEVEEHQDAVGRLGGGAPLVRRCGVGLLDQPATVVEIVRERAVGGTGRARAASGRGDPPRGRRGGTARSR